MKNKGIPTTPPEWLRLPEDEDAVDLYRKIAKKLNKIGKVRDIAAHTISLGNYVNNWYHYRELEENIRLNGDVAHSDNGNLYLSPYRTAQITRENTMQKELVNLGLTIKQLEDAVPMVAKPDKKDKKDPANFLQ